jgi:hypothetical protein
MSARNAFDEEVERDFVGKVSFVLENVFARYSGKGYVKSNVHELLSLCEIIDQSTTAGGAMNLIMRTRRHDVLTDILKFSRDDYLHTVQFLGTRIPREDLPNVQDVSFTIDANEVMNMEMMTAEATQQGLVADCTLPNMTYTENLLDTTLLTVFRKKIQDEVGYVSEKNGINGMIDEGREMMLSEKGTPEYQQEFVGSLLAILLTPVIPPIFRIMFAGMIPSRLKGDPVWLEESFQWLVRSLPLSEERKSELAPGAKLGPFPFAPAITSMITPVFMNFLVGPVRVNRRKDGALGGMLVVKCKSLQESGCKGLCLNQCKLPAQKFISESMGIPLSVSPNFATQECQWSFGEEPLPPAEDPSFPSGCLVGCPTRAAINERKLVKRCD